jgi:lysozyme family protein
VGDRVSWYGLARLWIRPELRTDSVTVKMPRVEDWAYNSRAVSARREKKASHFACRFNWRVAFVSIRSRSHKEHETSPAHSASRPAPDAFCERSRQDDYVLPPAARGQAPLR